MVYRLRVVLSGISPMIWRQLEVPATVTLAQLHELLQTAFAWSGEHLYRFTVHGREFGSGQLWLADPSTVHLADLGLRIIRARTTPPEDCGGPDARATTGGTTAAGSSGNKLTSHGFGRSPRTDSAT